MDVLYINSGFWIVMLFVFREYFYMYFLNGVFNRGVDFKYFFLKY